VRQEKLKSRVPEEVVTSQIQSETSQLVISESEESKADSSLMEMDVGSQSEIDRNVRPTLDNLQNLQLAHKSQYEEEKTRQPSLREV